MTTPVPPPGLSAADIQAIADAVAAKQAQVAAADAAALVAQKAAAQAATTGFRSALAMLQRGGVLSKSLEFAIMIAVTVAADVPGMGDVQAAWNTISAGLDGEVKKALGDATRYASSVWIAEDRQYFDDAVDQFQQDTEKTRKYFDQIEKSVDDTADAFRGCWFEIGVLAVLVFAALIATLFASILSPIGWAWVQFIRERIGMLATIAISLIVKRFGAFLAFVAGTLMTSGKGVIQLFNVKPTGGGAINFTQARISWTAPSQYLEPKKMTPTPYAP
jgi:phage-related protein